MGVPPEEEELLGVGWVWEEVVVDELVGGVVVVSVVDGVVCVVGGVVVVWVEEDVFDVLFCLHWPGTVWSRLTSPSLRRWRRPGSMVGSPLKS